MSQNGSTQCNFATFIEKKKEYSDLQQLFIFFSESFIIFLQQIKKQKFVINFLDLIVEVFSFEIKKVFCFFKYYVY